MKLTKMFKASKSSGPKTFLLRDDDKNVNDSSDALAATRLLHGQLRVRVIRARRLRNKDSMKIARMLGSKDVSDPYCTVHALVHDDSDTAHRLAKTTTKIDNLDPVWNEEFRIPVAYAVQGIEFRVKDLDVAGSSQRLGRTVLDVRELVRESDNGHLRTGVHKIVHLDGKPSHGTLEYIVEYVPIKLWMEEFGGPVTPGVYFAPHQNDNHVDLYVDADDRGTSPVVTYGPGNELQYAPRRLWRDIYDSMKVATKFIYVVGWSVDVEQTLLRSTELDYAKTNEPYSPYIGELLKKKAEEGVIVNVLVWDDRTSTNITAGAMGTKDELLRSFCNGTKINMCLAPMIGGDEGPIHQNIRNSVIFTHHQKCCVMDAPDGTVSAFMGGIDLTCGRWDNRNYPLFRSLTTEHEGDFYNGCFALAKGAKVGPRQPWHDIHIGLRGPAVCDLMQNFHERWKRQAPTMVDRLVDLNQIGLSTPPVTQEDPDRVWSMQLLRSIDARTAVFDPEVVTSSKDALPDFDDFQGVTFSDGGQGKDSHLREGYKKIMEKALKTEKEFTRRFDGTTANGFHFGHPLYHKIGRDIDSSVGEGMVHHIRRAQHTIYIESQYFLSSAHIWSEAQNTKCYNLVAAELTIKICSKIAEGKRFAAYVLIPMWPEGIPEDSSIQDILRWQSMTIQGVYQNVADAIIRRREVDPSFQAKPRDYISFYCLGTRETTEGSQATEAPGPKTKDEILHKSRRHPVYVHSKMMIFDDSVALVGSANINQRSLDGARDSELIFASWQPKFLGDENDIGRGDVHAFRLHCWAHVTGVMDDVFRSPSSVECMHFLNNIAERNWARYSADEPCDMDSVLMPYPILIDDLTGIVKPRTVTDCFPDTSARILGGKSNVLPEMLTT